MKLAKQGIKPETTCFQVMHVTDLVIGALHRLIQCGFNSLPHNSRVLMTVEHRAFENIMGKGENADNQLFVLFHNFFCPIKD